MLKKVIITSAISIFAMPTAIGANLDIDNIKSIQQSINNGEIKPYLEVKPVNGESRTVRMYYATFCPYSQQYLNFFKNLALTGQEATHMQFEITPVLNQKDGMNYALAYASVRRYYPNKIFQFVRASIVARQNGGQDPSQWRDIDAIGKSIGIPERISMVIHKNKEVLAKDVLRLSVVQQDLKITNTPSIAVAGMYIATPEITGGRGEDFSKLVNGLISMVNY